MPNVKSAKDEEMKKEESTASAENGEEDDDEEPEPDTTLFVKNLNFSTTEELLKKVGVFFLLSSLRLLYLNFIILQHFSRCGAIHYATIATKKDPKAPNEKLSMGYGFVRYKYKVDAEQALKQLQMTQLEGKTLELKRSERTLQ